MSRKIITLLFLFSFLFSVWGTLQIAHTKHADRLEQIVSWGNDPEKDSCTYSALAKKSMCDLLAIPAFRSAY